MEEAAKGATKGFLEHWEEKIPELVRKLANREIAFVENQKNYEVIKKEGESPEFQTFKQYAPKGYPRILFKIGLALREIESDSREVEQLKDDVYRKFGTPGVHIAELAQNGILTQLVTNFSKILKSPADVKRSLSGFLDHVDQLAVFIKSTQARQVRTICDFVKHRVDISLPQTMIVFVRGNATDVVRKILECVKRDPRKYVIQVQEDAYQVVGFIFAPELEGKLTHWSEPFVR